MANLTLSWVYTWSNVKTLDQICLNPLALQAGVQLSLNASGQIQYVASVFLVCLSEDLGQTVQISFANLSGWNTHSAARRH
ncbi:hypothetical protein VW35_16445 [Devosia soli]|uniref:Uncharacterized protein n=1 Tax=Devosia soli TaxID=361041 RepID=A0A0F5L3V8_9HYPH|nr:hypothetical protein VW35_16445 [Devosia soli]